MVLVGRQRAGEGGSAPIATLRQSGIAGQDCKGAHLGRDTGAAASSTEQENSNANVTLDML